MTQHASTLRSSTSVVVRVNGPPVNTFQFDEARARTPAREYQSDLVEAAWRAIANSSPGDRYVVSLATGGGKTRVMNDLLFSKVLAAGANALYVAPSWPLVAQAVGDACARFPEARNVITYIGGTGAEGLMFGAPRADAPKLTFVTLQTYVARRDTTFARCKYDVVVVDEVHYGEHGKLQDALYKSLERSAVFLGATATRRVDTRYELVGEYLDLAALVERGVLAKPHLLTVNTGVDWSPGIDETKGDFTARSLDELARNAARNQAIIGAYATNVDRLGPSILFACNIRHAELLAEMLEAEGFRAAATHSQMKQEVAEENVSRFRSGELDVIVNVRSLTTGVDIPHTRAVLLARPTTSDILLTQMIGRGSRRASGKDAFYVVDFVDNISGPHGVFIKRPDGFLGSPPRAQHRRPVHDYRAAALSKISTADPAVDGLTIQPAQTFSIALVLRSREPAASVAESFTSALDVAMPPAALGDPPDISWRAVADGPRVSVSSPILTGADGLKELRAVLDKVAALARAHGYGADACNPVHVHLGWCPELGWLRDAVTYFAYFEPALASLGPPPSSSWGRPRPARRSVRDVAHLETSDDWFAYVSRAGGTFDSFDMWPLFERGWAVDVPVRLDSLDGGFVAAWVSLAMHILRAAEEGRPLRGDPARRVQSAPICRGPRGSLEELCLFVGANSKLMNVLRAARHAVFRDAWALHVRYGRLARRVSETWQSTPSDVVATAASSAQPCP